ncbi:MAG TPA: c-type cytochrome, partial [Caulobacteraceae bacterium]|nr:c-type cytochrome [Caulobacteraceae bacterium]
VIAAPSTYEIGGEQYVAVMVGYGGAAALAASWVLPDRPRLPGRLLVFKLGGTAKVAPYPTATPRTIDLTGVTSSGDPKAGNALFHGNCAVCHGSSASGTYLPDLRTSPMILTSDNFVSVVLGGALKSQGMVSFAKYLTPKQAEDVRAYILTEAHAAQAEKPPAVAAK